MAKTINEYWDMLGVTPLESWCDQGGGETHENYYKLAAGVVANPEWDGFDRYADLVFGVLAAIIQHDPERTYTDPDDGEVYLRSPIGPGAVKVTQGLVQHFEWVLSLVGSEMRPQMAERLLGTLDDERRADLLLGAIERSFYEKAFLDITRAE